MKLTHRTSAWAARLGLTVLVLATPLGAQELIVNGGFETGDFTGWTQSGVTNNTFVSGGCAHTGASGACLGPVGGSGFLIQQVISTTPGHLYDINFWLQHLAGTPAPLAYFHAYWDGALFFSNVGGSFTWTQFGQPLPGSPLFPDTQLRFEFREDPAFWHLDDVSVVDLGIVPEPMSVILLGTGLVGLAGLMRRRRKTF